MSSLIVLDIPAGRGAIPWPMAMSLGLRDPWGVEAGPGPHSLLANCLANSEPMKAASNSQGPNRWRMEEHRGRAELGSGL